MMYRTTNPSKKPIEQYEHTDKERLNNPPVGLVTPETDVDSGKRTYAYDPHLDPQLVWAGKAEHMSLEVPTVSLHVHERIESRTIIEAVRKRNGDGGRQLSFFEAPAQYLPLRHEVEFYKHPHGWSNRLIAGDSLLVMNSLLEKEGLAGQVQMVYIDPPYGIKYGSNFQPFVNNRDVKDGKDEDLTQEPEMIKAFRDTWELGIHSYLTYLRDRLLLAKELLASNGSVFVQISDENVHLVRSLMDEVLGPRSFVSLITFQKSGGSSSATIERICDFLLWYSPDVSQMKFRKLLVPKASNKNFDKDFVFLESPDGKTTRRMSREEINDPAKAPTGWRRFRAVPCNSQHYSKTRTVPFEYQGKKFHPGSDRQWSVDPDKLPNVAVKNRLFPIGNSLMWKLYEDEAPGESVKSVWLDTSYTGFGETKVYVVQTTNLVVQRCLLMTTDPGDIVFDPTCGSGTTALIAEQWGRRWITCDTSRVAIALAKQRLMTAAFDYYELARPNEGVGSGFKYRIAPHIALSSIANNEPPAQEILYDQPYVDNKKARVTGPFTVEAVPAPAVKSVDELSDTVADGSVQVADASVARSGETLRQAEWRDELLRTGIRGKGGQKIEFSRVEALPGTRWLHAEAETREDNPQRAVVSFGPPHAPLEQRQVGLAIEEAQRLVPRPKIIVFATFQFDPEAAKDIDETAWPGVVLLKVQMNTDLLTDDLKKKRASNESFWLIGQPDVRLEKVKEGEDAGKYRVEVLGFDYYNTKTGIVESGGADKVAMWMLDSDYDGRSLFPRQVFFPMAGDKDGWSRLAKNLKAEIDEELIEAYRGTVSLPFAPGDNRRVAVKIVDDRGIECLKVVEVG